MSNEFDIRIGTQLDTSNAEKQLMDFIKKHSDGKPITFKVDVKGASGSKGIKDTEKSFKNVLNTAKQIGNTKIDVSKMLGSVTDSVAKGLNRTVDSATKKLVTTVGRTKRDLIEDAQSGISHTIYSVTREVKETQRALDGMIKDFSKAKNVKFIDQKSLKEGLDQLDKIRSMEVTVGNVKEVNSQLASIADNYRKMMSDASREAFKDIKLTPLIDNLKEVRTAMSAKNMDLSGIDNLIERTNKLSSLSISEILVEYEKIRSEFSKELKIPLNLNSIMNAETAIKNILKYKDELVSRVKIETDDSKIKQLNQEIQDCDKFVEILNKDLNAVGKSTVKNLIDSSNKKEVEDLNKQYDKLGKAIKDLNKSDNLKFIELGKLTEIKNAYDDIGKSINKIDFKNVDDGQVIKVTNDVANLKKVIENTSQSANNLSIKAKVDIGLKNAEQMLLGMESALVKTGKRTGVLNKLKTGLQEAMDTIKLDPSKGLSSLNDVIKAMDDQAVESGLKNITGGLQQYEKYINDYISLTKKASNTKDLGLAKTYEQEANRTLKALSILEKGMTQSQIGTANALKFEVQTKASEEFSNSILKTASAVSSYKKELQGVNKEVGFDKLVSKAGEKARQEYESLIDSTNKMQSKLSKMLSSDKVDIGGLAKVNAELEANKSNLDKFKNTSINIKCKEAIADLKELRKEEEKLGHNISGIDSNINRIEDLQTQLSKGLIGGNQVSKEIDAIEKEYSSMTKLTKKVNDAQKEYKKLVDTVSELKQNGKLQNNVFNSLDKQAENLKDKFTNLNLGTLTAIEVSKITGEVEKFASSVNNAKTTDLHLRLKADFDIDASKANVKINGLESALLSSGEDTKIVKSLRNKLQKYIETAVNDPALASKGVAGLLDNIGNIATSKDLGKVNGDLAQYKKYLSEIEKINKEASKTTDQAVVNKYKNQEESLKKALTQLESGFDEDTLKTAQSLNKKTFKGVSDGLADEIKNVSSEIDKYVGKINKSIEGYKLDNLTSDLGKGLANQFNQGISKADELKSKINEMLSSGNIDTSALAKIRTEFENLKKSMSGFDRTSISNAFIKEDFTNTKIPNLVEMLESVKKVMSAENMDTSGLDVLIQKAKELSNVDVSQLGAKFKEIQDGLKQEVKINFGVSDFKNIEEIFDYILRKRNELRDKISLETDSSKVKELNKQLEITEGLINDLESKTKSNLGGALINKADVENSKKLEKNLNSIEDKYNKINDRISKLDNKDRNLVDISELRNIQEMSEDIKKSFGKIGDNIDTNKISKITNDVEKLDQAVTHAEKSSKDIELDIKFNASSKEIESMINGIESAFIKAGKSTSGADGFKTEFESIKQSAKTNVESAIAMLKKLKEAMSQTAKNENLGDISGSFSQYQKYIKEWQQAKLGAVKSSGTDEAKGYEQTANRIENATKRLVQSFKEAQRESANTFKSDSFNDFSSKVNKEINSVINDINKFQSSMKNLDKIVDFGNLSGDVGKGLAEEFSSIMNKIDEVRNKLKNMELTPNIDLTEITKAKDELKDLENQADQLKKVSIMLKCSDSISELDKLESRMKEIGRSADGIDELRNKFLTLGSGIKEGTADIEGAVKELKNLTNQADKFGKSFERSLSGGGGGGNFGSKIQGFFQDIKQSFSQFTIGELMADAIQQGVYSIKDVIMELDSALADFARVAPDDFTVNSANLEKVASTAKQIAIDVGQSTSDVITGMSTALQAGAKTISQATAIAKQSAIFQNVTDMDAKSASKAVSTMVNQYFGMDKALAQVDKGVGATRKGYDNLTQAMDLANYAGNNFAISSEGVTQALSRGGSVLSNYGVSISDSIALISSANESIQDPQRVGNGLKTIALNLSGMKTNAKTGAMELNKTAKALKDIAGIDVFTDKSKTQTKDMMTLMNEIKGKWGELTDAQQKALSEGIAGKTQAQVFQSLMNGWSRVKEFQDAYNKGWTIGSAQRENEIYLDSIAGKWNTLKETMTKSITTVGVRDAIKDILDMATKAVEAVNKISDAFGKFGTIGLGIGITSFIKQMANFGNIDFTKFTVLPKLFSGIGSAFNILKTSIASNGIKAGLSEAGTGLMGLVKSSGLAKTALVGLKSVLTGLAWGVAIAGVVALGKALYDNAHKTEQFIEKSKEQQDVIRDNMQNLSSQKSSLSEIASEYDTLAKKTNKSAEELQRFSELKKQIAEISPELVSGYDVNGDPILKLNESLTSYMSDLDVAIEKQQKLYNQKNAEQAYAYATENGKKKGSGTAFSYNQKRNNIDNVMQDTAGEYKEWYQNLLNLNDESAQQMAKNRLRYEEKANERITNLRAELAEKEAKYQEQNLAMQSSVLNKVMNNTDSKLALESTKATESFQGLIASMDWGSLDFTQLTSMERGMQKLALVTKGSTNDMGEYTDKIKNANKEFKNTGDVEAWGKALQENSKVNFDNTSWSAYLKEVNQQYEEGATSTEQYNNQLKYMAQTISDLTGVDMNTVWQSLTGSYDAQARLDSMSSGLNNFLKAYNKTATDIRNGDSMAIELEKQFNAIKDFGSNLEIQIDTTGKVNVDWLLEQKENLPQQMQKIIDVVTKDNKVTEVEQKLLMTCQMQIQNEGKLSDDLTKQLEGIFDGSIDISNGITIEGIEFNKEEALALKEALAGCVDESGKLNLSDTGIEKLAQQAKEVEKALSSLGKGKLRVEFEKQGIKDNVEEINSLKSALEKIPKKQQLDFVTECGSAFNNVKTLEEGIKKIPPEKKLKFNIGVDGNKELESAREKLKNLPESIRTMVYNKVIGLNDLETAQKLVNKFGNEKATAILSISGIEEALSEATTFEELLQILTTEEWETKISAECEGADAIIKALEGELDKLTKNDKNIKIKTEKEETTIKKEKKEQSTQKTEKITKDVDADTSKAKNKTDKLEKDINNKKPKMEVDADTSKAEKKTQKLKEETEGKKPKMEVDTDTSGVEKGNKAVEEFKQNVEKNGKGKLKVNTDTTEVEKGNVTLDEFKKNVEENGRGNVKVSADTTEVEQAEKKVESLTTVDKQGIITLHVNGNEEIKASINDKKQLEVNGQAITMVQVDGGEQYSIAINEKGQLEVDGQALTKLDVTNLDSLTFAKNEKGELEVNGESITDLIVNGKEEPKEAKENVQDLQKMDGKNVSVNIDVSLKETVGEILSRLGLNKKTEHVELKVTCEDEATPVINDILKNDGQAISVTISCSDNGAISKIKEIQSAPESKPITINVSAPNAQSILDTVNKLQSATITDKPFNITATGGDIASQQISILQVATINDKDFAVNCTDNATPTFQMIQATTFSAKDVTVNCTDNATTALNQIEAKKISDKDFTVTCIGGGAVINILNSIIGKLGSIHSKSITITTTYSTIGKPPSGTVPSANEPKIIELQQPSFGSGTTQSLDAQTQAISNQAQVLSDEVKPLQDNVADVMATKPIKANIDTKSTVTALKYNVDLLNNMTNIISKLSIEISKLDSKMERAWGTSKSKLLKEQISLLTKQQNLTKTNIKNMEGMSKSLKSSLKKQGFKFKDDGSISNYNSKLIAMEKNVEKLEKKEEAYNKKYKNTSKLSKSKQKAVEKQQEANSKATEKARKQLELTKQKLQEYYDLQFNEMPNAKKDWEDLANSIAEAKGEIIKADREAKTFFEDMREEIVKARFDRDSTWADTFMLKADLSSWSTAVGYIEKANELLAKNQSQQEILIKNAQSRMKDNKAILDKNGFSFTKGGYLEKAEQNLKKLKKKLSPAEYEAVKEAYDAYVEDMYRTLPEAENQWWQLQQSIEENKKQIEETNKAMKEMIDEAKVSVLTSKFDSLSKSLDLIEVKMERVYGANKIYYIEDEIELLEQMQNANKEIIAQNKILASQTKSILSGYGVMFDSSGNITNLSNVLNGLGDLEKMEELKDLADKYNEYKGAVDDATISIEEEKNKIIELEDSMKKLEQEMKELKDQAWIKEFENGIKLIQNKVDKLDSELNISGSNQIKLLNEKIKAYEKLAIATENSLAYQEKRKKELSKTLISYGFEINDDGTINNTANKLESLKNTLSDVEFEIVSDALEGYFEVALDTIPELEKELLNYQKELQDIQKTKLEKTQKIENEITKIYEKQIEERKKIIEEEADAQIKALNKAKDAYNRYRDEVDYKDDYEEQLKKVEDLQKKLEIAKRDDSLAGQKRVADLMEQLQEEQKNLEDMVQDKIDNDINNMFDDQIDKIQTDADEEVKNLEDTWTESKIAEAVEQALNTGIFTDIDGNIKSLNTALIEFANTSSDYFGVMGAVLKTELIDNLKVAYSTMNEIQKIYNDLGTFNFSDVNSLPNVNIQGNVAGTPINNNTITIGDTNITVEGNADSQTVDEIELMLKDYQQKIYTDIMKNVK